MCCLRIIFVAVNKQIFLGQVLAPYMWVGIATNAVGEFREVAMGKGCGASGD